MNKYMPALRIIVLSFFMHFIYMGFISAQYNSEVLKAAYIERITRYIEWPTGSGIKDSSVFVIGVFEEQGFFNTLTKVLMDKTIKDRKVKVIKITDPDQIKSCDICYISAKGKPDINRFVIMANENGVLMMSESKDFGEAGIHINFFIEDEKLKFEINRASIDSGKLKVSSMLMKSSKIL
jgi:YfiR/HmsC-like